MHLRQIPSAEWEYEYETLMASDSPISLNGKPMRLGVWLRGKTDRERRLREISQYIEQYAPEIISNRNGMVIDVGPGPGEFLELARGYKHPILGIDAATGVGGMGHAYLRVSQLMCERQKVPVDYVGLKAWLNDWDVKLHQAVSFVNFRGSIEQAFSHRMAGESHEVHHFCKLLRWKEDGETRDAFSGMFARFRNYLQPGGCILVHANGSASDEWYDEEIRKAARETGYELVLHEGLRLHKWRKP